MCIYWYAYNIKHFKPQLYTIKEKMVRPEELKHWLQVPLDAMSSESEVEGDSDTLVRHPPSWRSAGKKFLLLWCWHYNASLISPRNLCHQIRQKTCRQRISWQKETTFKQKEKNQGTYCWASNSIRHKAMDGQARYNYVQPKPCNY